MTTWFLDEGLATFRRQWWGHHPGATIYSIADDEHSTNPRVTQHAPDDGKSGGPGDTRGEVDAVDVMPGKGVTAGDLDDLFDDLCEARDPRLLYAIHSTWIVSSVVSPWQVRPYRGKRHGHVHLSVNDNFKANAAAWKIGDAKVNAPRFEFVGKLPLLQVGMEDDAFDGYNAVARLQLLANYVDSTIPDLDVDGVFGANTARKVRAVMKGGNGRTVGLAEWRKLLGIYAA